MFTFFTNSADSTQNVAPLSNAPVHLGGLSFQPLFTLIVTYYADAFRITSRLHFLSVTKIYNHSKDKISGNLFGIKMVPIGGIQSFLIFLDTFNVANGISNSIRHLTAAMLEQLNNGNLGYRFLMGPSRVHCIYDGESDKVVIYATQAK
ncbi:uncharacterized protein LOC118765453 [Octopus sinensis]|uniref:Uncharacterized protein LOC118765453 n=1 Tax=Octopus sinensis TaxID=2607531 RepID=A0A7E6F7J5_9MOLL|nr:uncharacterized protein LOC118765453 [Octopus sinensis]